MSGGKQDNKIQPEFNLDELNGIPDETPLDKSLAWEKLYPRLHTPPRRKKVGWYWAAAASLCIMAIYGIGLHKEREMAGSNLKNRPGVNTAIQPPSTVKANPPYRKVPELKRNQVIQQEKTGKRPSRSPEKNELQLTKKEANSLAYSEYQPVPQSENADSIEPKNSRPVPLSGLFRKAGSGVKEELANNANAGVLKKKLRVVHLNELDEPAEITNNLARNSGGHTLRVKWMEQMGYADKISEHTYSSNDLVKINLTSSN
jgi:hypothetical protein